MADRGGLRWRQSQQILRDFSFLSGRADVTCWLYMPRPCGRTRITLVVTGVEMALPSRNGPANPRISGTWHLQLPRSRTSVDVAEVEDQIAIDTRLQIEFPLSHGQRSFVVGVEG